FGFVVRPALDECYSYALRVATTARRRGVAAALFAGLAAHASSRGLHGLAGVVSVHNRAAARVQRAIGARPRGVLIGLSVRRRHALVLGRWRLGAPRPQRRYAGDATAAGSARRSSW